MSSFTESTEKKRGRGTILAVTPSPTAQQGALEGMRLPEPAAPAKSGFDIAGLRLPQDFATASAETVQATILVDRPGRQIFFRAHPEWVFPVATLIVEKHVYLVVGALREVLDEELKVRLIVPCITRDGDIILWPLSPLQGSGRENTWTLSAHRALAASRAGWIRIRSNMRIAAYEIVRPKVAFDDPVWPEQMFEQLLETGFSDSIISAMDHPVIRALQGDL